MDSGRGVWCVVSSVWCVVCGVWCVDVWCVACQCVVCGVSIYLCALDLLVVGAEQLTNGGYQMQ